MKYFFRLEEGCRSECVLKKLDEAGVNVCSNADISTNVKDVMKGR